MSSSMATPRRTQTRPVRQPIVQRPPARKPPSQSSTPRIPGTPSTPRHPAPPQARPGNPRPPAPAPAPAPPPTRPPPSHPPTHAPPTVTTHPKNVHTGNENRTQPHPTEQTSTLAKETTIEKPYLDYLNDYVVDWKEPGNLEPVKSPRFQSNGRVSPTIRPLGTPPSLESYQNRYNLHSTHDPLSSLAPTRYSGTSGLDSLGLDGLGLDSLGLDPLGLDSTDQPFNDLDSYRREPSVLTRYKLNRNLRQHPKAFTTETRLNLAPPSFSDEIGTFALPSPRKDLGHLPNSGYSEPERRDSFTMTIPRVEHEPTNLEYLPHEAFTNHYVDDFIGKCIEDQFVPDILHETINELGREKKKPTEKPHKHFVDPSFFDVDKHIDQNERENTHLFSDDWIRELGYHHRPYVPPPQFDANPNATSSFRRIDFKEAPPMRIHSALRFHDLMPDAQTHLLRDYNDELINFELRDMLRDISHQTLADRSHEVPVIKPTRRDSFPRVEPVIIREVRHKSPKRPPDQGQYKPIENYAENNLLDTICLDNLIVRYIEQPHSLLDDDDQSRLLDGTILDNLIRQYHSRDEQR